MHAKLNMRRARGLLIVIALCGLVPKAANAQLASPTPEEGWGLHVRASASVQFYPGQVLPQFDVAYLAMAGCSPLYLSYRLIDGCPLFRDEPAWAELQLRWTGPGLAQLWPMGGHWAKAWLELDELGIRRRLLQVETSVTDGAGAPLSDGAIELADGTDVRVHLDFSRALESLPLGRHRLCYELSATVTPEAPRHASHACIPLVIVEPTTQRERAEHLRRKAIDLISKYQCDEALPVIEDLLKVHPSSASGFRLRGIVAELQRRNGAAVRDYGRAIDLLRTSRDELLPATDFPVRQAVEDLTNWRNSMVLLLTFAPELSLLGSPTEGPICTTTRR